MGMILPKKKNPLFLLVKRNPPLAIPLIFGISLLLTISCAYAYYDDLLEADFLSPGAKYESHDLDNFFLEKQNPANVAAKPSAVFLLWAENSLPLCSVFSLPPGVTDPTLPLLRC